MDGVELEAGMESLSVEERQAEGEPSITPPEAADGASGEVPAPPKPAEAPQHEHDNVDIALKQALSGDARHWGAWPKGMRVGEKRIWVLFFNLITHGTRSRRRAARAALFVVMCIVPPICCCHMH
jgi:hypothetical protein